MAQMKISAEKLIIPCSYAIPIRFSLLGLLVIYSWS